MTNVALIVIGIVFAVITTDIERSVTNNFFNILFPYQLLLDSIDSGLVTIAMALRLLLGIMAPGPPDQEDIMETLNYSEQIYNIAPEKEIIITTQIDIIQSQAKFHIGMLSISLIIGLAYGGFTAYNWWKEKNDFLIYIINLVIALVCRTFFSIIFDGAILLGSASDVGGGNTLLAFEQMCINLVTAFWLTLTIYLHARVQRNFKSEPTLNLYKYGVPAVALFFAFIWIFLLQDQCPNLVWWFIFQPLTQWIVNSFNLLCLLIQLALVGDMFRMMMKTSLDNDSISLFRKIVIMMGVLVLLFWIHVGLLIGRVPMKNSSGYGYFFCFIDGTECAIVCVILYFFSDWVEELLKRIPSIFTEESLSNSIKSNNEELLAGSFGRGMVTLDRVFMTTESGRWKNSEDEGERDVVYSNVVEPERLTNILNLYKRWNNTPSEQVTVIEGEEFFDCQFQDQPKPTKRASEESKQFVSSEDSFKKGKVCDRTLKKSAFYSSKYLILDSKPDFPKYLETRPSIPGRGSWVEDNLRSDYPSGINAIGGDELVRKWLSDNSDNMQGNEQRTRERYAVDKSNSESKLQRSKSIFETTVNVEDTFPQANNRVSFPQKNFSKLNADLWDAFSGTGNEKNSDTLIIRQALKRPFWVKFSDEESDLEKDRQTEMVESKERKRKESLNSLINATKKSMLSTRKEETFRDETNLTTGNIYPKQDLNSQISKHTGVPVKAKETDVKGSQKTVPNIKPDLIGKVSPDLKSGKKGTESKEEINKSSVTSLELPLTPINAETKRLRSATENTSSDSEFSIEKSTKEVHKREFNILPPYNRKTTYTGSLNQIRQIDSNKTTLAPVHGLDNNNASNSSSSSDDDFSLEQYYQSVSSARTKYFNDTRKSNYKTPKRRSRRLTRKKN